MAETGKDILQAVIEDDTTAFDAATGKHKNLCIGRFSLLAVCYLYGSRKIVAAYAGAMRQGNPVRLEEERRIYNDFVKVAGKAIRLWSGYTKADVLPCEMLALLGDWHTLKREYPRYVLSESEQARLLEAIRLRYGVRANIDNGQLVLPKKPVDRATCHLLVALSAVVVVLLVGAIAVLATGLVYRRGTPIGDTAALGRADPAKQYALSADVTLDRSVDLSSIHLDGVGHTLYVTVGDTPWMDTFSGVIENCTIVLKGTDIVATEAYAPIAVINAGVWRNVRFEYEADVFRVTLQGFARNSEGSAESCAFGGLFVHNEGTLESCTLHGDAQWMGQGVVDGELGSFASTNGGTVKGCVLEGNLTADTIDVGGLIYTNQVEGVIAECTVKEGYVVAQTTSVYQWSPQTGGICAVNYGTVENTYMYGGVSCGKANVTYPEEGIDATLVRAGGIVSTNCGVVRHCLVTGEVQVYGEYTVAYAGGIAADNYYDKSSDAAPALLDADIVTGRVYGSGYYAYLGGIVGASSGYLNANCFNSTVEYDSAKTSAPYVGSVIGYGNFAEEDAAALLTDNHACRMYYKTLFGYSTAPVIGYYEQLRAPIASIDGVTEHDTMDFTNLEAYWYGK